MRAAARFWPAPAALGALVLLVAGGRSWAEVAVEDPAAGAATVTVAGTQMGATLTAGALLAGAALVAGLTGTPLVRRVAGACLVGAAALAAVPVVRLATDAPAAVRGAVAERTALSGAATPVTAVDPTAWPWLALLAVLAVALAGLLAVVGPARGPGPAGRAAADEQPGAADAWDRLSAGEDPTDDGGRS